MSVDHNALGVLLAEMLDSGVSDRAEIDRAAIREFSGEVDATRAIETVIKRAVSLEISRMRDSHGERLAFPVTDADGTRRVAHMEHVRDPAVWLGVSRKHVEKAKEHQHIATRTYQHATQLNLFTGKAEGAA